jgi:hypothetical protein
MHKEILLDGSPTYPNAKTAPFRVFDVDEKPHWDYLFLGDTMWFESSHDMRNFLRALLEKCFATDLVMGEVEIFEMKLRFSASRVLVSNGGLWIVIEARNCTAIVVDSFKTRSEAEQLL